MSVATASPAPAPRRRFHRLFLKWLPRIRTAAAIAFRHVRGQDRDDLIAETVANAYVAMAALANRNALNLAFPSVLSRYAISQIKDGRRVGGKMNCHDASSQYCQRVKNVVMERLDCYDEDSQAWDEVLVEDKHAGPADIARTRIDFSDWLASLKRRDRRVAEFLAAGQTTKAAARRFRVSSGRISQLRRELAANWRTFCGDDPGPAAANAA